jgi:hypothetical protein
VALIFVPGQPGKRDGLAADTFSAWYKTKFSGFGAWSGWWSFFEAGFEKDPHGPGPSGMDVDLIPPTPQLSQNLKFITRVSTNSGCYR